MSAKPRAYVTYFDQRYVGRAHAMLRSLRRHDPDAEVFVLCFDDPARQLTTRLVDAKLSVVSVRQLYDFDRSIESCSHRKGNAFRATHKGAFAWYVLNRRPELGSVAHVDADTYFYSSPAPLYEEIGAASVAVSPHRFVFNRKRYVWYGHFNAGYIYWKNDDIGRRCLTDYRDECIAWCEPESLPDGRFMNQGYLTAWPKRYPGVHVIEHPGVNLAPWNVAGHRIEEGGQVLVDGRPLIFFHFSSVIACPDGLWRSGYTEFGDNLKIARRAIYAPYLDAIERGDRWVAQNWPGLEEAEPVWTWTASTILRSRRRTRHERAAAMWRIQKWKLRKAGARLVPRAGGAELSIPVSASAEPENRRQV